MNESPGSSSAVPVVAYHFLAMILNIDSASLYQWKH